MSSNVGAIPSDHGSLPSPDGLAPAERDLFWLLCCLLKANRRSVFVDIFWVNLDRPGTAPELKPVLTALVDRGLVAIEDARYVLDPGIADAGRAQAGPEFRRDIDERAAGAWLSMYEFACELPDADRPSGTKTITLYAIYASAYLGSLDELEAAAEVLHRAFARAPTADNAKDILPIIRAVTKRDPLQANTLAYVLTEIEPSQALTIAEQAIDDLQAAGSDPDVPWIRELLLRSARKAAIKLERWQDALDLNAARIASMAERGIPDSGITRIRMLDGMPLGKLGRTSDERALLLDCRQSFYDSGDFGPLSRVLDILALIEANHSRGGAAVRRPDDSSGSANR